MTAKHRKGKTSQHGHEDNSVRYDAAPGQEARAGGGGRVLLLVLLLVAVGGASGAWFCLQQREKVAQLVESLEAVRVKVATMHEETRRTHEKVLSMEVLEQRLHALEEVHAQSQRQAGVSATEWLKASDLSAQIVALQAEMKASLAEVRGNTVADEQLEALQRVVWAREEEFNVVNQELNTLRFSHLEQGERLVGLSAVLSTTSSKLEEWAKRAEVAETQLESQAVELLGLKRLLAHHETQLEANTQDITRTSELMEVEKATVKEQLSLMLQSFKEQSATNQRLQAELQAQIEAIQRQLEREHKPDSAVLGETVLEEVVALALEELSDEPLKEEEEKLEEETGPGDKGEQEEQEIPVSEVQNLEVRKVGKPQGRDIEEVPDQELVEQQKQEAEESQEVEITGVLEEEELEDEGEDEENSLEEKEGQELQGHCKETRTMMVRETSSNQKKKRAHMDSNSIWSMSQLEALFHSKYPLPHLLDRMEKMSP
ncbi:hypothetical protein GN956_G18741 [Arapaima gigas]